MTEDRQVPSRRRTSSRITPSRTAPILSIALGLAAGTVATGAVALGPQSGMVAQALGADGTLSTITIATGTLTAM